MFATGPGNRSKPVATPVGNSVLALVFPARLGEILTLQTSAATYRCLVAVLPIRHPFPSRPPPQWNAGAVFSAQPDGVASMDLTTDENDVVLTEFQLGAVKYAIAFCPGDSKLMVAWQCPTCAQNNGGARRFGSHVEAMAWAKVRAAAHHADYHAG